MLIILGDLFITLLSQVGTWTPKKGRVAEPGFCGHAPGKGVIQKEIIKIEVRY